jgi:hypothetical protein
MARHRKLVVDELLTKPSAVSPMLFVGLGGCGCRMVARISEHLRRRSDFEERYRELVKFALVDTNINDLEAYREIADETFLISDFEKEEYADLASGKLFLEADPFFTQWVPPNYRFRAGDTAGAGQIRIESRLGVFYQMKHKDLVPKFRKLLEALKSHEHGHRRLDSAEIRIVICYSVAGGTGSGCHLPIAYMLRDQASQLGKPTVLGVAVLPAVFEDKTGVNKDGTFANSYAALKETEHLMKLGAPESRFFQESGLPFHYDPSSSSHKTVRQRPFEFVYLVDKPESFSVSDPIAAAADGLYLQFFSPIYAHQASDYDNYTQHQRFLVPHDFEGKGIVGFTSFYGSYGAAVLHVPVEGLVEYCSQAAALALMRASFLHAIPGEAAYNSLRGNPEAFYEVTLGRDRHEKPIAVSEFAKKEPLVRERLLDRLYMKRVRLLAACELLEGEAKRFYSLFRHGHRLGEIPKLDGTYEHRPDGEKNDEKQLAEQGMRFSICSIVLPALAGIRQGEPAGLIQKAQAAIESYAGENRPTASGSTTPATLKSRASGWVEDYRRIGMRVLNDGYKTGTLRFPGMDALVDLQFLRDEAGEIDLAAKRYAVLSILERVDWNVKPPASSPDFDLGDLEGKSSIHQKESEAALGQLEQGAIERAMETVKRQFVERLGDLKRNLDEFVSIQRVLEQNFETLERDQTRRIEQLREQGDVSANRYVLDAEALQTENGRRMWDFYYEDRIAPLPDLGLGDREIQRLLSDTVTDMSVRGRGSVTASLDKLFSELRNHSHRVLRVHIGGDPHAADPERRDGLTLSDALELEVIYRALYFSNTEAVDRKGPAEIRNLVAEYKHLPPERRIDLSEAVHQDYLRDKIKRLVKERASLLCFYDESRDQHGGVRPDLVFVAAIDENFKNSAIEEAIRGADSKLTWVTKGWHNPKEIIFYQSVLNVPLYVFGRMRQMKEFYYQFRNLAKRPKVLHIDQNWEYSLPDLDPDSAQEKHRQDLLRDQVINFATLLTSKPAENEALTFVVRREGKYHLLDPMADGDSTDDAEPQPEMTELGATLAESIARLPEILDGEKVKYFPYQRLLRGVREGLAPEILHRIVRLPFLWRRNHDELRTQYGSNPLPLQHEKLKDYSDAFARLREALDKLLEKMRNRSVEQRALGEDGAPGLSGVEAEDARKSLAQSLELLDAFSRTWRLMESPEQAGALPESFHWLFRPIKDDKLPIILNRLREMSEMSAPRR